MKIKPKKCRQCSVKFTPQYSSLQVCCSPKCASELAAKKRVDEKVKEMKSNLLTLSDHEQAARVVFQKWINLRDKGKPCAACGVSNVPMDASHYFNANQWSGLIFSENNVHSCCQKCNRFLGGNLLEYRKGLVIRYGNEFVNELETLSNFSRNYRYTKEELIEIKQKYQQKIKELNANRP